MEYKKIVDLLKDADLLVASDVSDVCFSNIKYDSRLVDEESIFVCKGLNFKKDYLLDVISKGAKAYISEVDYNVLLPKIIVKDSKEAMALVSKALYKENRNFTLIGVTATKGKTTTVEFIKNIIDSYTKGKNAYWTTIDHYTGKRYAKSHNTTPEIVDIYEAFKDLEDVDLKYFTMEVSSQATKLKRIFGLDFDIGVFLNISEDHISPLEHKDFEEYLDCKIDFLKQCKTIFLYRHTDYYDYIKDKLKDKEIYTFGSSKDCDYIFSDILRKDGVTNFKVSTKDKVNDYKIKIAGNFNVINATCAIAVANYLNIPYESILEGISNTLVLGRMNMYELDECPIIIDYAHNKLSVEALMKAIKEDYPNKKIRLVFGTPGDKAHNRRKDVGTLAGMYADYIYLTAEDPQTKKVIDISNEIKTYIKPYNKVVEIIEDREEAIIKAINDATNNDVVAIIGKGDETYQLVNNEFIPYKSDIKVVEEIISKKKIRVRG